MIEIILEMLSITESKAEEVQVLQGKYELKLNLKEALRDIKKYG